MRIEQQNNIIEMIQQNSGVEEKGSAAIFKEKIGVSKAKHSDNQSVFIKDATYLNPALAEGDTLAEELEEETCLDATDRKNQMAVLSHTTSEEDYEKMQEEGFSLDETNGNTIVTVVDKIKMQIAKAGGDISCFGDGLSAEEIEAMAGSEALASQLEAVLKAADLPLTEENKKACMTAYYLADSLKPLNEGGWKYMLDNQLEPTIENFYKAAYSGSYAVPAAEGNEFLEMKDQVEGIIREAGLLVNEQTLADSNWLLANEIALTAENLNYLEDLKASAKMLTGGERLISIAGALAEGYMAKEAMMLSGYSNMERAQEAVSVVENATDEDLQYLIEKGYEFTVSNLRMAAAQDKKDVVCQNDDLRLLTTKRQLEETRLAMTVEANYSLLKRGISIDIKPLTELVEELKQEEHHYYASLLDAQGVEASEENVTIFAETAQRLQAIRSVPAYVIGIPKANVSDIQGVYDNGMALKTAMEKAKESYETLMTEMNSELGDSIEKAFGNVDEILSDLDLDLTEENRRAIRILAYNQLEINEKSVLEIKAADEEVQRVFKNLSPRVIIEMIRKGENPLEMDFGQLNRIAEGIKKETDGNDSERFSEFLWKLEKNNAITEEERSSFIGIYRLIHQVEQTDGAAVGALVNQGAEITLKNLLMAVRSGNKQNRMNIRVDDSYQERSQAKGYQNSIVEQIMTGYAGSVVDQIMSRYQNNCLKDAKEALTPEKLSKLVKEQPDWMEMTPEQLAGTLNDMQVEDEMQAEYARMRLESFHQCAETSEEVYQLLEQYDIPNSMQNILAMEAMVSNRNQLFKKLLSESQDSMQDEIEQIKQQLIKDFGNAVSEPKELAEAQEALGKLAEDVMKTMMESDTVTSIDIREARLMQTQISLQKQMAKKETYSVPILVGDEVTNVTLKIVRGTKKRGIVDIMLESRYTGKIAATFQAAEKGIRGTIATDNSAAKEELLAHLDEITAALQEEGTTITVAHIPNLDLMHFSNAVTSKGYSDSAIGTAEKKAVSGEAADEDSYEIQTTRLYRIAESFIKAVKEAYS